MQKHIFIIGPGATGKTVLGKLLAQKLKVRVIDIDDEFVKFVGSAKKYCNKYGYGKYHAMNSNLFYKALSKNKKDRCVFVISPGMLIRGIEKNKNKNINVIRKNGVSILLMPDKGFKKSVKKLFKREKKRNWYKDRVALLKKIKSDIKAYRNFGDIKIYINESSKALVIKEIIKKLAKFN